MHWGWWLFWVVVLLIVGWAFWRLFADRLETRKEAQEAMRAEEALRERFARGDIDEEEFALKLKALQASRRPA
jgi:putative membrane protein